jgi:hypothetical protein
MYEDWKLYEIEVNFKHIGKRKMYFFSKRTPKRGKICDMPQGYVFGGKSKKTGMPYLKYKDKLSLHQRRKQIVIK